MKNFRLLLLQVARFLSRTVLTALLLGTVGGAEISVQAARTDGILRIIATDKQTHQPIAVRMELRNARGRSLRVRPSAAVSHDNYIVFDGEVTLELRRGQYEFYLEAGPEYQTRTGRFTIDRHADDTSHVELTRRVNMQDEGWWAGDLDVAQPQEKLPLMMQAAGVDIVPVTVAENRNGKCLDYEPGTSRGGDVSVPLFGRWAAIDNRRGGGLLLIGDMTDLNICNSGLAESSLPLLQQADEKDTLAVALTPFCWDLPLWVASGKLTAIQILHRHALLDEVIDHEGEGRPRDKRFYPGPLGNGRYSEGIYHHLLNCGLRIPPAAGSGSGVNGSPVGTNRTYVHCGSEFSRQNWLAGLQEGKVMVTNGPLLRTSVEGHPPGYVFNIRRGGNREFQIGLSLTFYEKAAVEYLEIVKNGEVAHHVRLDELAKKRGQLPPLTFTDSGWFLVRAMTNNSDNYQYASTGPYYVQAEGKPRISRQSVKFFLDWIADATHEFAENQQLVEDFNRAKPYWEQLLEASNAE